MVRTGGATGLQDMINADIVRESNLAVVFFKRRLGATRGTVREVQQLMDLDIEHTAAVASVDSRGTIVEIVEGTGKTTVSKSCQEFQGAMTSTNVRIADYARLDDRLARVIAGMIDAQDFMGDGNWVTPGNENLRRY
ncbi:MAG: hypothetical protein M3N13_02955 [Candidatus Eremiobacteraeota bacterium]|nr:hypothetical protein [Candidatus Eremiobacteraeota bacterium]